MLDAIASCVLEPIKSYAVKEVEALADVGDRIMLMNDKLEWLKTFVRDVDHRRRSRENPYMAIWVSQTRDITYQVEDVVDDYSRKDAEMGQSWWKCVTHPFTQFCTLNDLAKRMDKIEKRLQEISENTVKTKIKNDGASSSLWSSSSTTRLASWDNFGEDMIGFDGYVHQLGELLVGPKKGPRCTISVIGERGIGKTKLARKVYDSEKVQKHFKICSWLLLPPKTRVEDNLTKIHKEVDGQVRHKRKVENIESANKGSSSKLMGVLDEDRYLVVLDGISSIIEYNSIKAALPDVGNGSRVLLIMRPDIESIEQFADLSSRLEPKQLDEEKSKQLFISRVFGNDKNPSWFEEKTYEKDVFTITQGLPLAIVVLAGLLRSKESPDEWVYVFNELKSVEKPKSLSRLLAMSFDDLPHNLKSCFMYFGALPENRVHKAHKLVRMWIAEGFVKPKKGCTMEEIGQSYLKELVSRCLIELVNKDAQGDVHSVTVQNLIHAFVQSEALAANFFEIHDSVDVTAPNTVRRLSIQNFVDRHVSLRNSFPKTRSLVCHFAEEQDGNSISSQTNELKYHSLKFFRTSKFLRVIELQGLTLQKLPKEVGTMVHLRYLGVRHCGLKQLPSSIGNLICLQTFDIEDTDVSQVNDAFWKIPTLRHVFARRLNPPKSIPPLISLQMLHGVDCINWDTSLLEKIINLRSLELQGLTNSHSKTLIQALGKLEFLMNLKLRCAKEPSRTSTKPSAPPEEHSLPSSIFNVPTLRSLHSLEIYGKLENKQDDREAMVSDYLTLPNLTKLTLQSTKVGPEYIIMISKLPRLSVLKLEDLSYDATVMEFSNGFRSLRELHLRLRNLMEWRIDKDVMPELASLFFWGCGDLKMMPAGVMSLLKLKEMMVYDSLHIAERIKKNKEDRHKVSHVPIIRVRWKPTSISAPA